MFVWIVPKHVGNTCTKILFLTRQSICETHGHKYVTSNNHLQTRWWQVTLSTVVFCSVEYMMPKMTLIIQGQLWLRG